MTDLPRMFPPWMDRLQLKYINPVVTPLAGRLPGLSKIKHRGRRSGNSYETVVTTYRMDNELAIVLGHGKTDWVKNVLAAGEADVVLSGRQLHLVNPRIMPPGDAGAGLPAIVRLQARRSAVFVADIA